MRFLRHLHYTFCEPADDGKGGTGGDDQKKLDDEKKVADESKKTEEKIDPLTTDIKAAIEKARKQEKDKLYGELTASKEEARKSRELADSRENELKALRESKPEVVPAVKPDVKDAPMTSESVRALLKEALEDSNKQYKEEFAKATKRIKELESGIEVKDLVAYRDQLISANKEAIIPELVVGNTKEDLDTSLVTAKQVFARVSHGLIKKTEVEPSGAAAPQKTITLPPNPSLSNQGAPGAPTVVNVAQMSEKDFKSNREALLRAAGAEALKGFTS